MNSLVFLQFLLVYLSFTAKSVSASIVQLVSSLYSIPKILSKGQDVLVDKRQTTSRKFLQPILPSERGPPPVLPPFNKLRNFRQNPPKLPAFNSLSFRPRRNLFISNKDDLKCNEAAKLLLLFLEREFLDKAKSCGHVPFSRLSGKIVDSFLITSGPKGRYSNSFMKVFEDYLAISKPIISIPETKTFEFIFTSIESYEKLLNSLVITVDTYSPSLSYNSLIVFSKGTLDLQAVEKLEQALSNYRDFLDYVFPGHTHNDVAAELWRCEERKCLLNLIALASEVSSQDDCNRVFKEGKFPNKNELLQIAIRMKNNQNRDRFHETLNKFAKARAAYAESRNFSDRHEICKTDIKFASSLANKIDMNIFKIENALSSEAQYFAENGCPFVNSEDPSPIELCGCLIILGYPKKSKGRKFKLGRSITQQSQNMELRVLKALLMGFLVEFADDADIFNRILAAKKINPNNINQALGDFHELAWNSQLYNNLFIHEVFSIIYLNDFDYLKKFRSSKALYAVVQEAGKIADTVSQELSKKEILEVFRIINTFFKENSDSLDSLCLAILGEHFREHTTRD